MQEQNNNKHLNDFDDGIDVGELFRVLILGKWIILSVTTIIFIIGFTYSLLLPNIYESKALLVPVSSSNGISGSLKNYGGLAGLAGISLPSPDDNSNSVKAKNKLISLSFFQNNILKNIYLPDLMAVKSWNFKTKKLVYDESIYEKNSDVWVRNYYYPQKQIPSSQESFEKFITEHLSLSEDNKTGFLTLSIKHQSPFIAKQWTELVFNEINTLYKEKDKSESEIAVDYLNKQISITVLSEIKQVLAELLQEEIQKLTLIEARQFYVFDYIDPPEIMEKESEPNRVLICILSALLGLVLSVVIALLKHYGFKEKLA